MGIIGGVRHSDGPTAVNLTGIASHLATAVVGAGLGALATFGLMDGQNAETAAINAPSPEVAQPKKPAAPSNQPSIPAPKRDAVLAAWPKSADTPATSVVAPTPRITAPETTAPKTNAPETTAPETIAIDIPPAPAPKIVERQAVMGKGDNLMSVLMTAGAGRRDAYAAIEAMREVYDPRRLRVGQAIELSFEELIGPMTTAREPLRLTTLSFKPSVETIISSRRGPDGFVGRATEKPLFRQLTRTEVHIEDSLYLAGERAGIPAAVIVDLIHIYSFDVDFQRDIRPGDRFEVFYETFHLADGGLARSGVIQYARLKTGGLDLPLYRFVGRDGEPDFYNEKGDSVRKALMKTPVDGARLSSRFGNRRHPILGFTRMHKGVDFAAPRGTPVMAAGTGKVKFFGRKGGYGKYIQLRHNSEYSTAYAHLSRYARGLKVGKRVKQGQIIGYVGSTGRSTGPHLHYEVIRNGRQMNPLGLKLPTGRKLKGGELADFINLRDDIRRQFAAAPVKQKVARND